MTGTPEPLGDARFFAHEAMKTTFTLRFRETDDQSARGMARECFDLIDRLEAQLSRFIETSDVSRINRLAAGETLYLGDACHRCLLRALEGHAATGGLFDITQGKAIEHRKSGAEGPPPAVEGRLIVHPDVPAVTCEVPGREIDLGGIGKGFALDEAAALLAEWGAGGALLAAGASSLRALGDAPWPVDLTGDSGETRIALRNESLSASGTGIQGRHIVHPGGEGFMPLRPCLRVWVVSPTAAMAEVWSTAMMLVDPVEMPDWLRECEGIGRLFVETDEGLREVAAG